MPCNCHADTGMPSDQRPTAQPDPGHDHEQRRVLTTALLLNAAMFVAGLIAGILAQSTGLIADSLDMFADALAFGIALAAAHRSSAFKSRAATLNGSLLFLLGLGMLAETTRRALLGSHPDAPIMLAVASASLAVNAFVLYLLARHRHDEVHLRAAWIFTRADVIASAAVILSALIIRFTGFRLADILVGYAIALYILKEATEILRQFRQS